MYDTLLFLVLFVSFRLLPWNHPPSDGGVGVTVVLLHIFLKGFCRHSYGVLGQRAIGVFISGLLREFLGKSGAGSVFLNEVPLWAENSVP